MSSVHCKKRFISVSSFLLSLILVFTVFAISPAETSADTVSELQSQIKDLEAEQAEIEAEIKKLQGQKAEQNSIKKAIDKKVDNLQNQINLCNSKINQYNDDIKSMEAEIAQKNKEMEETKFVFQQRLRAIYMSGGSTTSSLNMLLDSNDLSDVLAKSEMTKSVSAYDNNLLEGIVKDTEEINSKKKEIISMLAEQSKLKSSLNEKKGEYNAQVAEVEDVISDINSDQAALKKQVERLEAAIKEFDRQIAAAQHVGKDQVASGEFLWPTPGYYYVTSPFGYRIHPISGTRKFHKGVDISGSGIKGKPIVASDDGIVSIATYNSGGYGYYVMINHGTNKSGKTVSTLYAHMTKYIVSYGQQVKRGQVIGYVGSTGASTGPHLHYEIRFNNEPTNPMAYF